MGPCTHCHQRGYKCRFTSNSSKCGECICSNISCDVFVPSVLNLAWVKREEEHLASKKMAAQMLVAETAQQYINAHAHLKRLEMEQELLQLRGDEMVRRGLRTINELEAVKVVEGKEAIENQLQNLQASFPSAAELPFLDAAISWADIGAPNKIAQEVAAHWQNSC
jgi:hypothetical protein